MPSEVHTKGLPPVSTLSSPEQSELMKNENAPLTHPNPAPNRHTKNPTKQNRDAPKARKLSTLDRGVSVVVTWRPTVASADWGSGDGDGGGGRTGRPGTQAPSEEAKDC